MSTLFNSPTGLHDKKSADSYTFAPDVVPYAIRHACSLSLHHAVVGSRPAIAPPFTLITGLPEYFVHTTRSGSLRLAGIAKHCISLVLTEYDNTGVRAASFNTVAEPLNTPPASYHASFSREIGNCFQCTRSGDDACPHTRGVWYWYIK